MFQTIFVFISTILAVATTVAALNSSCKCTADNRCWPSKSEWDALSATLRYPVFNVVPPGYFCHDPNYNPDLCAEAQKNFLSQMWATDQPGGSIADNWEFNLTSWCFINDARQNPCGQGRVPSVGVNATSVQDVQNAMAFANLHNLKVHVKTAGHDYLGRGLGPGSMLIWTHFWKGTTFHSNFIPQFGKNSQGVPSESNFTDIIRKMLGNIFDDVFDDFPNGYFGGLSGGPPGGLHHGFWGFPRHFFGNWPGFFPGGFPRIPAITVLPGTQWYEVYKVADDNKVTIGGAMAINGTVGACGGYSLGGGHSYIGPFFGLAADNLLEVSVVLPNASLVTANIFQNWELFWAIRGGGGPSFGIVTSMTFRVIPQFPVYGVFFEAIASSSATFVDLLDSFHAVLPLLAQVGWSGYYPFSGSLNYFALVYILPYGNSMFGNFTLGTWIDTAINMPGVTVLTYASRSYPSYGAWLDENIVHPRNEVGFNFAASASFGNGVATGSWLLTRDVLDNMDMIHRLSVAMSETVGAGLHVAGGLVSLWPEDYNAVHPAWRHALVNLVLFRRWEDGTSPAQIQKIREDLSKELEPMRALTPKNMAQYLNEPDMLVPDFMQANWGRHYARLSDIKSRIDPNNMLLVFQGVNSESWDDEQICPR